MKRIVALLMTVIMLAALFPASILAQAQAVTKKPFYMVNWARELDYEDFQFVDSMPYTWISSGSIKANTTQINIGLYFDDGTSSSNVETAAQKLYDAFSDRPAGTRYINLAAMATVFKACVKDAVDMEQGVALVKDWLERLLDAYKKLGGQLDGIAVDLEYSYAFNFYLESYHYNNSDKNKRNTNIYNDIVANPVYQKRIRPKLVERGFEFYVNPNPTKYPERSEIWTAYRYDDKGGKTVCRTIWNQTIQELLTEYINEATWEPLVSRYPNAVLSDYGSGDSATWYKGMTTSGENSGYNKVKAGNATNENYYGTGLNSSFFSSSSSSTLRTIYNKPASYNSAVFESRDGGYTLMQYNVNNQKILLASTPDEDKVNVWVGYFNYGSKSGYANTPYYSEMIYHMGMSNPEPFLGYILPSDVKNSGKNDPNPDVSDPQYSLKIADELMAELTRVAGASDRKAIETPISWNDGCVISGMYAGGRNIWRITPDTNQVSLEAFKVKDKAPTFSANGVTITFPQGRIISDSKITHVGTCGYWVETPANVTPVITSNASRYSENPSFEETFGGYAAGAFTSSSANPDTYWTVSGKAEIQEENGNKAVVLSGTTTLTNSKVTEQITAGDYYAKQQVWEVTVTLPASGYGKVKILNIANADDGGIRLTDGKLYYDQSGAYKELSGVSLSAGTYTVRRELDFRTEGSYTSSYAIYDAKGNRLGGVDNVPIEAVKIPVVGVELSVIGATDKVRLDDYKLYPTGVSTALDLYTANFGQKLKDTNQAVTSDTAYRVSWMNATNQYKVASIYDAKSGAILQKVEMAPGMDGVVTGIAKASASKSVLITVDVQDSAAPNQPNYDNGNFGWTAVAESLGLAAGPKPAGGNNAGGTGNTEPPDDNAGGATNGEGNTPTEGVDGTPGATEGNTNVVDPTGGESNTGNNAVGGNNTTEPGVKKGLSGGIIALIVILSLAVLAGGGVAAYIFVIKPKLAAKSADEKAKETSEE